MIGNTLLVHKTNMTPS